MPGICLPMAPSPTGPAIGDRGLGRRLVGEAAWLTSRFAPPSRCPPGAAIVRAVVADLTAVEDYFLDEWVRSLAPNTRQVILDLDRTDDPLYGMQEGRFFQGYYGEYCYTPLYIFAGHWPVVAALHTADHT